MIKFLLGIATLIFGLAWLLGLDGQGLQNVGLFALSTAFFMKES